MKKDKEFDIELKSESMNEMLSDPPKWVVRYGSSVFLIILFVFLILTWFIEYPDEISGEALVTTTKPPIELSNQSYIQLKSLDVKENQHVEPDDLIAQFDIQAKSEDIIKANTYLATLEQFNGKFKEIPEYNTSIQLGVYQEQWTRLLSMIKVWNSEYRDDMVSKEITSMEREIQLRNQLESISDKKIHLTEEEYQMIKTELASSERLAEQNAISKQTLATDKRTHSQALQSIQNQKEQKIQNLIALNTLKIQLTQLRHNSLLQKQQKSTELQIQIVSLKTAFQTWEKNAIWVAPCSGKVVFNKLLQVNRYYKANEASVVIVPNGSGYFANVTVNTTGAGKLKKGQKSFIELIDYPKSEFGVLEGKVKSITQIDKEGKYEVQIELPKQLKTTYGKVIPYKAQFKGTAKIITNNKRLLARFFEKLTAMLK